MSTFKVGDTVQRAVQYRGGNWARLCRSLHLPEGSPFVVTDIQGEELTLGGCNEHSWTSCYFKKVSTPAVPEENPKAPDSVNSPKHYQFFPDLEAIEVIARSMTQEQFYGYCLGNRLKYRLRAGNKDKLEQDIAKSDKYSELYEQHRGKCIDA